MLESGPLSVPALTALAPQDASCPPHACIASTKKLGYKALYNGRRLGKMLREINQAFVKHWCLLVQDRRLTKHLSRRNRHRCLREAWFIFLSISHCTRPKPAYVEEREALTKSRSGLCKSPSLHVLLGIKNNSKKGIKNNCV